MEEDVDGFLAGYESATNSAERLEALYNGVDLFSADFGIRAAEFMELCEKRDLTEASKLAMRVGIALQEMSEGMAVLAILIKRGIV